MIAADLAGGRPLHPATWQAVLEAKGFTGLAVHLGPLPAGLTPTGGRGPEAERIDAAIATLNELVQVPSGFAVVASR